MVSASVTAATGLPSTSTTTSYASLPTIIVPLSTYDSLPTSIPGTRHISSDDSNYLTIYTMAGPLTTAIPATAASCRQVYALGGFSRGLAFTDGLDCKDSLRAPAHDCMPGGAQNLYATGVYRNGTATPTILSLAPYFSPATGCPVGYATACTTYLPSGMSAKPNEDVYACCLPFVTPHCRMLLRAHASSNLHIQWL